MCEKTIENYGQGSAHLIVWWGWHRKETPKSFETESI